MGEVIDIFKNKTNKTADKVVKAEATDTAFIDSLKELEEKNKKNKERVEKERLQANKGVIRSHNLKK